MYSYRLLLIDTKLKRMCVDFIYINRRRQLHKLNWDDIQIPSVTMPMVPRACTNSRNKFCCCSGKLCQSVRLGTRKSQEVNHQVKKADGEKPITQLLPRRQTAENMKKKKKGVYGIGTRNINGFLLGNRPVLGLCQVNLDSAEKYFLTLNLQWWCWHYLVCVGPIVHIQF